MTTTPTLCLDLGGTEIKAAVTVGDEVVVESATPVDALAEGSLEALLAVADELLRTADVEAPSGVGIAVPGIVDPGGREMTTAFGKFADLTGVDLTEWSERHLGAPARVEHDARAALIGETAPGAAGEARGVVLVTLGTGIGTAAMIDGTVFRGENGHGGILGGHVTVDIDGPRCPCGNVGCAEALASTWALPDALARHPGYADSPWPARIAAGGVGVVDLIAAADSRERVAVDVLDRCLRVWAGVVVTMAHAFEPDAVVLTGGVLRGGERIAGPIRRYVDEHLWSSIPRPPIVVPRRPDRSVLRGLALLAAPEPSGAAE